MSAGAPDRDDLVVTGTGVLCAIGSDVGTFTAALRAGRSGIRPVPDPDGRGRPAAALLPDFTLAASLDQLAASVPGRTGPVGRARSVARRSPRPVQAAVVTALQAWAQAGLDEAPVPGDRIGIVVGGSNLNGAGDDRLRPTFDRDPGHLPPRYALQYLDTDHVGVLSQVFGVTGEGSTVGAASASGNAALIAAARLLETGAVDACVVVGALAELSAMQARALRNVGAMAEAGAGELPPAPFDARHRGFVYGQGSACVVLEPARAAGRRGAAALARLSGYALTLDGNSLADPSEDGETRVMAAALRRAGLEPAQIGYVSAHGSGSPLGDTTESAALRRLFGGAGPGPWLNATKALTGHCLSAAGLVEAVATIAQLRAGFVHPTGKLQDPADTGCRLVGPVCQQAGIDHALSNSFGFGGFNTAVVLSRVDG